MNDEARGNRTLAEEVQRLMKAEGLTLGAVAAKIGYSSAALSQYLNGKYSADSTRLEEAAAAWLEEMTGIPVAVLINGKRQVMEHRGFYESKDAQCIINLCRMARTDHTAGLVIGESGFGKTTALRLMGKREHTAYIECTEIMTVKNLLDALEDKLGLYSYGSLYERSVRIQNLLNSQPEWLVILDEADKLILRGGNHKLETIRGIFDQADAGLILAGEPCLLGMLERNNKRMRNRLSLIYKLHGLDSTEVADYLAPYDVDDKALEELTKRACNTKNGCFRLLVRTLQNCFRLMKERDEQQLTIDIIRQASAMMML